MRAAITIYIIPDRTSCGGLGGDGGGCGGLGGGAGGLAIHLTPVAGRQGGEEEAG